MSHKGSAAHVFRDGNRGSFFEAVSCHSYSLLIEREAVDLLGRSPYSELLKNAYTSHMPHCMQTSCVKCIT